MGNNRAKLIIELMEAVGTGGDGQEAGKLEIASMTIDQAYKFMEDKGFDYKTIPDFETHFKEAQRKAKMGWTKRREMPVIELEDVRKLQARLKSGTIDIEKPFAKDTNPKNPFPQGLSGFDAAEFMKKGLKDGSKTDDQIKVRNPRVKIKELIPIQKQIYFDKSLGDTIEFGLESSLDFIQNQGFFIISKDRYIIDGHHRFLTGMIINPDMGVGTLEIDLPINKLLPLTLAYSDAIGHKRNQ